MASAADLIVEDIEKKKLRLHEDIEDFKKLTPDFQSITKAATNYRQSLMTAHDNGLKLITEFKKLTEKVSNNEKWAKQFLQCSTSYQEVLEESLKNLHTQLWDIFILPAMNAAESDAKDLQQVEKFVKTNSSQLDSQAKKEVKESKKNMKKNAGEASRIQSILADTLHQIKDKHDQVQNYFQVFKERHWYRYLSSWAQVLEYQKSHHQECYNTLARDGWKSFISVPPGELPQLGFATGEPQIIAADRKTVAPQQFGKRRTVQIPASSSPTSSPSHANNNSMAHTNSNNTTPARSGARGTVREDQAIVREGMMTKKGQLVKNWKKRFFIMTETNLSYFSDENAKNPLGTIPFTECSGSGLDSSDTKHPNCISLVTANRTWFFSCETPEIAEGWLSEITKRIGTKTNAGTTSSSSTNSSLKTSSSTVPNTTPTPTKSNKLPPDWAEAYTEQGEVYYYNEKTQETSWDRPT